MTTEIRKDIGFDEVKAHLQDKTFVIDTSALKDKNNALINGGFSFINTLQSFTFGKIYFVSSKKESAEELNEWVNHWHISSHQLFMRPQVWDPKESKIDLIKGLNAARPGQIIVLTNSPKFEKEVANQCPEVFKIMKVDNKQPDFNYHRVWFEFHNQNFWSK